MSETTPRAFPYNLMDTSASAPAAESFSHQRPEEDRVLHGALTTVLTTLILTLPVEPSVVPAGTGPPQADTLRTFQPEDLFRLHRIGEVRFSPDGRRLAFERARSANEGPIARLPERPEPRADIWVADEDDSTPRRLTTGASDGAGWFHPRWSPDGEHLAFLSIDGNRIRAWVWESSSDEVRPVTDRPVHLSSVGPLVFHWLSEGELALAVRLEGAPERDRMLAESSRPGLYAVQKWQASWSGHEVTADVLESDPDVAPEHALPWSEVRVHDLDGNSEVAAEGRFGLAWPSPDGRWLATFSHPPVGTVAPEEPLHQWSGFGTRPGAVALAHGGTPGATHPSGAETIHQPLYNTLQWAPDGSRYAFLFEPGRQNDDFPGRRLAVYEPASGGLETFGATDDQIRDVAWTGDSRLLLLADRASEPTAETRLDWWQVPRDGEWKNLTADLATVPTNLVPVEGGAAGVADGVLWEITEDDGAKRHLDGADTPLHGIVWPAASGLFAGGATSLRSPDESFGLLADSGSGQEILVVEIAGSEVREVTRVPVPEGEERPADVAPSRSSAVFSRSDDTGTWLFRQEGGPSALPTAPDTLLAEDRWLAWIDAGETRRLDYEGLDGREVTAWVILPPDHPEGGPHPTVVSFYPGTTYGDREPAGARLNRPFSIGSLQPLASRGYAVLFPTVPLGPDTPARPRLAEWILPAVDRAAAEGLVDPARLGIMGHSYGGFGVNHLVSQTDRFQAAVSLAGSSHLRSHYGTLDARGRYGHMAHPEELQLITMAYFETGQGGMGAPPFQAPERYRDGSPLTYSAQIDTPLLLIHGDQDFISIQQAEMLFTELLRRGSRARLVRYAGEGHTVSGRANVTDMWERIFDWWEEFLGEGS